MLQALHMPGTAMLQEPLRGDPTGSIVCGNVSMDGDRGPYRRFVYNRAGGVGAVDDGSDLFDKFANKICLQQH